MTSKRNRLIIPQQTRLFLTAFGKRAGIKNVPGLMGWYDSADSEYMEFDNKERLSIWKDKSGTNNDLKQPVPDRRPLMSGPFPPAEGCVVGAPGNEIAVKMRKDDVWMYNDGNGFDFSDGGFTFIVIISAIELNEIWKCILSFMWYNQGISLMEQNSIWHALQKTSKDWIWGESPSITTTEKECSKYIITYSSGNIQGGTAKMEINRQSNEIEFVGAPIQNKYGKFFVNSLEASSHSGDINYHEIAVFNRVLTTSEKQFVQGNLAWKWHIEDCLPWNHPYAPPASNLILKVKTDNPGSSDDNQFTLPLNPLFAYDYLIDWGDGQSETSASPLSPTHTYAVPGEYQIGISGTFPTIFFNNTGDKEKLIDVSNWGDIVWGSWKRSFFGCKNCLFTAVDTPDTSNVIRMDYVFQDCHLFNSPYINNIDTSKVTNLSRMFRNCYIFNQSVNNFDTANAVNMSYMFYNCHVYNQSVSNFDTSNVNRMAAMFFKCYVFNQSLSNFDTSKVYTIAYMFYNCYKFNQDVSHFDTGEVTEMIEMFYNCHVFNQDISSFNIGALITASHILTHAEAWSTENYNKLLIAWEGQTHNDDVLFGCSAKYTSGGAEEAARSALVGDGWTIKDGGAV